jgi:hypothetical protein
MMKTSLVVFTLTLAACSSTPPPPPPQALGPIVKVNTDEEALAELIRAARAGLPKQTRYSAERGDDVKSVLAAWTKTARLKLVWSASTSHTTPGAIDEPDIRAATLALAVLLGDQSNPLLVEYPDKNTVVVSDFPKR